MLQPRYVADNQPSENGFLSQLLRKCNAFRPPFPALKPRKLISHRMEVAFPSILVSSCWILLGLSLLLCLAVPLHSLAWCIDPYFRSRACLRKRCATCRSRNTEAEWASVHVIFYLIFYLFYKFIYHKPLVCKLTRALSNKRHICFAPEHTSISDLKLSEAYFKGWVKGNANRGVKTHRDWCHTGESRYIHHSVSAAVYRHQSKVSSLTYIISNY